MHKNPKLSYMPSSQFLKVVAKRDPIQRINKNYNILKLKGRNLIYISIM